MIPTEPTWRSYIAETTQPIFSPKQCQMVIDKGMSLKNCRLSPSPSPRDATLGRMPGSG